MRKRCARDLGDFWLAQRPGRQHWYICWSERGQVRRKTTGTSDHGEAKRVLAEHVVLGENLEHERPEDVPLMTVLERYYREHASKLPSAEQAKIAIRILDKYAGELTVAEFNLKAQERVQAALEGRSEAYVARIFSVARAALRRAYKREEIERIPPMIDFHESESRDRVLATEEAARLFDAANTESQFRYLLVAFSTGARPEAILDLTRLQLDFDSNLIRLNPQGRRQTKKRRPVIPMVPTLRSWLVEAGPGHVIAYGNADQRYTPHGWRAIFRRLVKRAGLVDVTAKTIRHTVATELARRGVSEFEYKAMLGHSALASGATAYYVHARPDFLANAARAIEDYLAEINRLVTKRSICRTVVEDQPTPDAVLATYLPLSPRRGVTVVGNTLMNLVGVTGFEPATPTSRTPEHPSEINSKSEQELAQPTTENQTPSADNLPLTCHSDDQEDGK